MSRPITARQADALYCGHYIPFVPAAGFPVQRNREIRPERGGVRRARLWLQDGGEVFKEYLPGGDGRTEQCIGNLLRLSLMPELLDYPELTLPSRILFSESGVVGYTMPFRAGRELDTFLCAPDVPKELGWQAMIRLAACVRRLPSGVMIGDLHGENVLAEADGSICIVDCDSFSLEKGNRIASPARPYLSKPCFARCGKYFQHGDMRISRETDVLSFFILLLRWLTGTDLLQLDDAAWFHMLERAEEQGLPPDCSAMIRRLFSDEPNTLDPAALEQLEQFDLRRKAGS